MADTSKTTRQLKLVAEFVDGDTRTITLDNPKASLTAEDFGLNTNLTQKAFKVLIGDKAGADFKGWKSAGYLEETVVKLDLG